MGAPSSQNRWLLSDCEIELLRVAANTNDTSDAWLARVTPYKACTIRSMFGKIEWKMGVRPRGVTINEALRAGTGGAQNGWQCSVAGLNVVQWCEYRQSHCHWVWVNWLMEKNMFRIECTKAGDPNSPTVCGYCYNEWTGDCCLGSENEPPCVAPPGGPGS